MWYRNSQAIKKSTLKNDEARAEIYGEGIQDYDISSRVIDGVYKNLGGDKREGSKVKRFNR